MYTSDGPRHEKGFPIVYFGVRGLLQLEFILQTARFDNHSGNKGGVIPNSAWELVRILSALMHQDGSVTVPGFYDSVKVPSQKELAMINEIPFCSEEVARVCGVDQISFTKEEYFYRLMFSPTLSINGLVSGYSGDGAKTIIPAKAAAKIDIRLVPYQDPLGIYERVCHFVHHINPKVEILNHGYVYPSRTDPGLPVCKAIVGAVGTANGEAVILIPSMGGTLPDYIWTKVLYLPSVIVPYANADQCNHAPNENITLDCYFRGLKTSTYVLMNSADSI